MSNPILLNCDLAVPTYSWSAGVNASYPLVNLKTYYPDQKSRSNALTDDQTFNIDFGAAVAVNMLVIDGCNFGSLGSGAVVTLQYNSSGWQAVPISLTTPSNNSNARILTGFSNSFQEWRLLFHRGSALAVAPEIGNIFLGTNIQFETTQSYGYHHNVPDWSEGTSQSRALDGRACTAEVFGPIRKHSIEFGNNSRQSDALITSFLSFLETASMRPFYYVDHNGALYLVKWAKRFNPYKAVHYNQNTIDRLEMESVMAG